MTDEFTSNADDNDDKAESRIRFHTATTKKEMKKKLWPHFTSIIIIITRKNTHYSKSQTKIKQSDREGSSREESWIIFVIVSIQDETWSFKSNEPIKANHSIPLFVVQTIRLHSHSISNSCPMTSLQGSFISPSIQIPSSCFQNCSHIQFLESS